MLGDLPLVALESCRKNIGELLTNWTESCKMLSIELAPNRIERLTL